MDSIVDTVLDIISKCIVAASRPDKAEESAVARGTHLFSEISQDADTCGICLSELFDCTGEDGAVMSLREVKCPGSHKFHSQCLRSWLDHSKRSDCPMCRHNFYGSVRKDCAADLEHQVQPCPTAGFKCLWIKSYEQRVAAVKILGICKSFSDSPFDETVASALLWSLLEQPQGHDVGNCGGESALGLLVETHIPSALEVLTPHLLWPYCVSLVKAFDAAAADDRKCRILHVMRTVSSNEECCATLVSAGSFRILLNSLKMDHSEHAADQENENFIETIAFAMYNFVLHEELGPGLIHELLEAFKVAETENARQRFAIIISEIALDNCMLDTAGSMALISGGACFALIDNLQKSNTICNDVLLASHEIDYWAYYFHITAAIQSLAYSLHGCLAFVDAGACDAFVAALRIFRMNVEYATCNIIPTCNILNAMNFISEHHIGCVALAAANTCPELIGILNKAGPIIEEYRIAGTPGYGFHWIQQIQDTVMILSRLVKIQKGCEELMKIDSCGALVEILQNDHVYLDEKYLESINYYIVRISRVDDGRMINSLVKGLHVASNDCARCRFSAFLGSLAADYREPSHLVSAGACGALVQAFKMTEDDDARSQIICDMQVFSRSVKESRVAFVAAGAVGMLNEYQKKKTGLGGSKDCAIEEILYFLGEPGSLAAADDDCVVKKRNTSDGG
jgi:hypothetical protein